MASNVVVGTKEQITLATTLTQLSPNGANRIRGLRFVAGSGTTVYLEHGDGNGDGGAVTAGDAIALTVADFPFDYIDEGRDTWLVAAASGTPTLDIVVL